LVVTTAVAASLQRDLHERVLHRHRRDAELPAMIAFAVFGSMRGPALTQRARNPESSRNCAKEQGSKRGDPDSFQATRQQSREAKHDNEHRDRQHRRDRRVLAATTCAGQYDEVAGDMGGEQPAKPDEPMASALPAIRLSKMGSTRPTLSGRRVARRA